MRVVTTNPHPSTLTAKGGLTFVTTKLHPSTLTARGKLTNVTFDHEGDPLYFVPPRGRINQIKSNYGVSMNPSHIYPIKKIKSNRGRKKKEKKKKTDKFTTTFRSQSTIHIASDKIPFKEYKIKLFKTGAFIVPGGLEPSMRDVKSALNVVKEVLSDVFMERVEVINLQSVMRNYTFRIKNENKRLRLENIFNILKDIKKDQDPKSIEKKDVIIDINYQDERYTALMLKFNTPLTKKPEKTITIKMFKSGKINIDGAISEEIAEYYYIWINKFFINYDKDDNIMFIPLSLEDSDSESDTEDGTITSINNHSLLTK